MLYFIYHVDRPNSLELRTSTRLEHLAYLKDFDVRFAGPTIDEDTGTMDGSVIVVDLPGPDAVQEFLENDPYKQSGLFQSTIVKAWKQVIPEV